MIIIDKHEETRKMIRAVIYIRFSSKQQAESFSIEYQQEECLKYIERQGYKYVGKYIDKAKTGKKTAGREALDEMLYDAGRNKFDKIIVFSFSRAFRNTRDALNTNHELNNKHGIVLESVIEPIDMSTAHGKFSGTNLFAMHELQSDILAAHVKSGLYVAAKQGYYLGGIVNIGYNTYETGEFSRGKPRKKYCINEEEAKIVKMCFQMYVEGYAINYIRDELNRIGLKTRRGYDMSSQTLSRMFKNEFYVGIRRYEIEGYDPLFIEDAVPAIIDVDTWNAAQMRNKSQKDYYKKPTTPRQTKKRFYPLTGKIECVFCGKPFTGEYKGEKRYNVEGYAYYSCSTKKTYRKCKAKNIRKDILEDYCIKQIKKHILTPDKIKEIAAFIMLQTDSTPQLLKEEFDAAEKRKRKVMDTIVDLRKQQIEADELTKEINSELIADYSKELAQLNEKLARLESIEHSVISEEMVVQFLNECALNIDSPDPHVLKSVFDKLIDKIIISDDKVEIFLVVFPFNRSALKDASGCPVYSLNSEIDRKNLSGYAFR